jgi:3-dehydrosphinganine reductase
VFRNYRRAPDVLFCVAGGSTTQMGFLAEIEAKAIESCMESNYYSAVFCAQSCLKRWLLDHSSTTRHMVFTSSTAAFVGLPGYISYTPAKVAVRALADTLRQELLLYGDSTAYRVHCCFPGSFISEGFVEEHAIKPELTRQLEGVDAPIEELEKTEMSSLAVAKKIVAGLEKGDYFITVDLVGDLLLNNMRGPSPRDRPLYDFVLGLIAVVAWFFTRIGFDKKVSKYRGRMTANGGNQP